MENNLESLESFAQLIVFSNLFIVIFFGSLPLIWKDKSQCQRDAVIMLIIGVFFGAVAFFVYRAEIPPGLQFGVIMIAMAWAGMGLFLLYKSRSMSSEVE